MRENTNKAIAINSVILYIKMAVMVICSVFTTRFSLQALGVVDFGLYSVLGGIISFMVIFNTIMVSTSHRFMAVAIGKGDTLESAKQFNVNLLVHVGITVATLFISLPVGNWYIANYINYDGDISKAVTIFDISVCASALSFIGVPYNALLMAKERFIVFTGIDIVSNLGKLVISYLLLFFFSDKLLVYTIGLAFFTVLPVFIYYLYCKRHFREIVDFFFVKDWCRYKDVLSFSLWVSIGAVAMVGKNQGASLLVNSFFNTVMNTALGIAHNLTSFLKMFSYNVIQPMSPQITKSYASGDTARTDQLLMMSTKYAFLIMFLASSPFLVAPDWLLFLWLGSVPPFAVKFLILLVVDNLIISFNAGISNVIFASGKIKSYQIVTSLLNIFSIVVGFVVLNKGVEAYFLICVYIVFSIINVISVQLVLHHTLNYDNMKIIKNSYIPSFLVVLLFVPLLLTKDLFHPFIMIVIALLYLCFLILYIGLTKNERTFLYKKCSEMYVKCFSN